MRIELAYGNGTIAGDAPEGLFRTIAPPVETGALADLPAAFFRSLDNPVGHATLSEFLKGKKRCLIVISDATRNTGASELLPLLKSFLDLRGIAGLEFKIAIALGIHRPPTGEEIRHLTGAGSFPQAETVIPDSHNPLEFSCFGQTSRKNAVKLHQSVSWADAVLVVGAIGYHYFAGFSGGRKSLLPGLACHDTISFNHRLFFDPDRGGRHARSAVASLDGNPVHEDMVDAMKLVGWDKIFLVNTFLNGHGELTDVICGHPILSHSIACQKYHREHSVKVSGKADLVIAGSGGMPRDINMVQSHKLIEMARYALKDAGVLIAAAACPEGMGHPDFFPWFRFADANEFCRALMNHYVVNGQTAFSLFEKTKRFKIILVSGLPPADVRKMGMIPEISLQSAIDRALSLMGPNLAEKVGYVLPAAGTTYVETTAEM